MDRKLLSECDFGLSYRYYRLIAPAREGSVEAGNVFHCSFPCTLIIHNPRLRSM